MSMISNTVGSYPSKLQGTMVFDAGGSDDFKPGETVTGTNFSAKVCSWTAATKTLVVKKIVGNPASGITVTGGTSTAAWVVATITATTSGGIGVNTGGWNIRETPSGITKSTKSGSRVKVEVMLANQNLSVTRADFATPATFTLTGGGWPAATAYDVTSNPIVTFSIKSSEPTRLPVGTTYAFAITGVGAKTATLSASSSDAMTHTFSYSVVNGDLAGTEFTITTGNFNLNGGTAYEIADSGARKALTAPIAVGGSLASKTGITITDDVADIAAVPTFTLTAFTSASPYDVSALNTIKFSVTASEAVTITGTPTLALTVGANPRTASYTGMVGNVMTFEYQVVAGDQGVGLTLSAAAGDFGGTYTLADNTSGTPALITQPIAVIGATLTQGTVTIQA